MEQKTTTTTNLLFHLSVNNLSLIIRMKTLEKVGMLCSYTANPTGEKHTISTFVGQTRIQLARPRRKKQLFSKLVFQVGEGTTIIVVRKNISTYIDCIYTLALAWVGSRSWTISGC